MKDSYIKTNSVTVYNEISLTETLYRGCQFAGIILIVYYCWYVEAFGNQPVIVYGSFLLLSFCLLLIHLLTSEIRLDIVPYGIWNYGLMIAYSLIVGVIVSYDRGTLLHAIRQYLIYFIIIYAFCVVSNHVNSYDWILLSVNFAILICCFHLILFGYHYSANRIVLSSNSNPNILGTLLNLGMFTVLYRVKFKPLSLLIAIPEVCFIFYNVIMTGSRKSFIVSIMILITWFLAMAMQVFRTKSRGQKVLFVLLIICATLAFYYYYMSFIVNTEVIARMGTMGNEESNSKRIAMYREAFQIFLNKPVFGGGLDQYRHWSVRGGYSHSTYAEAIADFGLIGSILYFLPFVYTIIRVIALLFDKNKDSRCLLLLGLCIVEFFLGTVQIWFFEMGHVFSWAIIFIIIQIDFSHDIDLSSNAGLSRGCKYVKY